MTANQSWVQIEKKDNKMRIPDLKKINNLVQNNELREALDDLLVICEVSNKQEMHNEVINMKARLIKNNRENRSGLINKDDFDREENKIRHFIIQIKDEIEDIPQIHMLVRRGIKELIMMRESLENYVEIDYSNATEGEINKIKFQLDEFENIHDLMNGIYLEMASYFSPFTYGKSWKLTNRDGNDLYGSIKNKIDSLSSQGISEINLIKGVTLKVEKINSNQE